MATGQTNADQINETTESAADDAKSFVERASGAMANGFSDAADYVVDSVRTMTARSDEAAGWASEQMARLRDRTRAEPIKALAIAAGIGAVLGRLFLRR